MEQVLDGCAQLHRVGMWHGDIKPQDILVSAESVKLTDFGSRCCPMPLNRRLPGRPAILRRLVAVFEQMRDTGKAAAFLRAYQKVVPGDPWAASKAEHFRALGLA